MSDQPSMYAPDYLRKQNDRQLHAIAQMIELQIKHLSQLEQDKRELVDANKKHVTINKALQDLLKDTEPLLLSIVAQASSLAAALNKVYPVDQTCNELTTWYNFKKQKGLEVDSE